ncbi:MAG: DMT family transporter [Nocardioides sp.]
MLYYSSATRRSRRPLSLSSAGLLWGFVGVAAFSFTVPLTRIAVGGLSPLFIGSGRAVVAALLAAAALAITRQAVPTRRQWIRIAVVAAGVVAGFPLLTSYALTVTAASHGAVVIGFLPAATAVVATLRAGERQSPVFWMFSVAGAVAASAFALASGTGVDAVRWADLLLLGAVVAAAIGYAEGGVLAREIGAWQTISWALVLALPVMSALLLASAVQRTPSGSGVEWACFGYLSVVSMYVGFFAWYRGLAIGPMARVSQVQLVQPVMSICWAALLLGEQITWLTVACGILVVACAGGAVRLRFGQSGTREEEGRLVDG